MEIVKDGGAPTWANKCAMTAGSVDQRIEWSGGTGTVDPDTGVVSIAFDGDVSLNFYAGLLPFTIADPVLTVGPDGKGQIVATMKGFASSIDNPNEKEPIASVGNVVVANLAGVDVGTDGFNVTPAYAGVIYDAPSGGTPQNRTTAGWGSWPKPFVDFQNQTGLSSYWYSSGGAADSKKAPSALTVSFTADGPGPVDPPPPVEPGEDQQSVSVVVPDDVVDPTEPGEFSWTIEAGDRAVSLSEATNAGGYLQSTGEIKPVAVTDTRTGGPQWSISGQLSDFSGGLSGKYLGWSPKVLTGGAGATAGPSVSSGISGGNGLSSASVLASAPSVHGSGTASVGADLDLRLPTDTEAGTYTATLTITALS